MLIKRIHGWEIPEPEATPEALFFNRREALALTGTLALGSLLPGRARAAADPTADLYPAKRNDAYQLDRAITPEELNTTYNNFYEFGSHKRIYKAAEALETHPWEIKIDGLVESPVTLDVNDLVRRIGLEERLYRHRCVEAWSMAVPWTGFPVRRLVEFARPLGSAKYLRMETFMNPKVASGQRQSWYPWPYVEGLTMAEAANDLAFLVTGAYGKPLAKSMGAPLRLAVPWKYGFKSIKSIVRFSFVEQRPKTFWETIEPSEYGFWANVNPEVPHPRWSQATEEVLGTHERRPTQLFNGYGAQVADLYKGLEGETLYR
jgi:sulfoxide reductase catalytic subunit YedY